MIQHFASVALGISTSIALSVIVKATVILAAGLLLVRVMRTTRAARRYVVLAWTFAALCALPIVVAFAPAIPVVVRDIRQAISSVPGPERGTVAAGPHDRAVVHPTPLNTASPDAYSIVAAVTAIWATGAAVSLLPVLITVSRLRILRRTARSWSVTHPPREGRARVLVHEQLTAPIVFGWLRPSVLLPRDAETWPAEDVRRALAHEMEHVERRDWPVHVFARLVCALYWFHPLVWKAWRQLHLEADRACDDAVATNHSASEFAEQLVTLAARIQLRPAPPVLSMTGGNLATRVNALLNPNQARGRSGAGFMIATSLAAILVGAAISTVEAVERITPEASAAATHTAADPRADPLPTLRPVVEGRAITAQANRPVSPAPAVRRETPAAVQPQGSPTPVAESADYVIGVGDILAITYWEQKELTGEYAVRPDGKITVPLIHDVESAGLTPAQLRDRLTALSARLFEDPRITVGVKEVKSRRVYIVGAVVKPGPYDLLEPMNVLQLVSVAGGLRDFVTGRGITILRNEDGKQRLFRFDYREVMSGQNLGQNIVLGPGDTVIVPE